MAGNGSHTLPRSPIRSVVIEFALLPMHTSMFKGIHNRIKVIKRMDYEGFRDLALNQG